MMAMLLRLLCALAIALPGTRVRAGVAAIEPESGAPESGELESGELDAAPPVTTEPAPAPDEGPGTADAPSTAPGNTGDKIYEQLVKEFRTRFQAGRLAFNRGSYTQAALEFEAAFAAIPAAAALSNLALAYERAGDHVAAAQAAKRYLALPACDTPDVDPDFCGSQREELQRALDRLMRQVGRLTLSVAAGVRLRQLRINGRLTSQQDFPLLVEPGRIDVDMLGPRPDDRRHRVIEVRAGEEQQVLVEAFDVGRGGRDPLPTTRKRGRWLRPTFWTGLGLTAASASALVVTGSLAVIEKQTFEREQELWNREKAALLELGSQENPERPYPIEHDRRFHRYRDVSNALTGVTAGLAMITAVIGLFAFTQPRNRGTVRASTLLRAQRVVAHHELRWLGAGVAGRF